MRRKILLIDESAMLRRIAANILQEQPSRYEVVVATRAVEGFAMACAGGIDLVLLDSRVAGAGGVQLCHRLHQEARTAEIPVILLTAREAEPAEDEPLPSNVVDTLVKPFAPEELSGLVNAIFGFTRTGSSLADLRASLHPLPTPRWSDDRGGLSGPPAALNGSRRDWILPGRLPQDHGAPEGNPREPANRTERLFGGYTSLTSLRTVMHSVADSGLTGILRLRNGQEPCTEVLFDQGQLVAVSTRDAETYAARAAEVMPPKVSAATLESAVAEQRATGTPFLLTLGTTGLLSKSSAVALLRRFGQRQFARLWQHRGHPSIQYEFVPLDALPHYALRIDPITIGLDAWLFATTRELRNEDVAALLRHEGTVGTPFHPPGGAEIAAWLELNPSEQAFLRQVNSRNGLPVIANALGLSQEAAYLILHRLRCLEVLHYRPAPAAFVMTPRTCLRRVLPLGR